MCRFFCPTLKSHQVSTKILQTINCTCTRRVGVRSVWPIQRQGFCQPISSGTMRWMTVIAVICSPPLAICSPPLAATWPPHPSPTNSTPPSSQTLKVPHNNIPESEHQEHHQRHIRINTGLRFQELLLELAHMDPAQGQTQGKSMTSKLKAKVKGVKGKVHLPGHKKRHGDDGQGNEGDSDYSSDDSPKKPGPETGYNVGASTPFTTVKATPLSPARERASQNSDPPAPPQTTSTAPSLDQYRDGGNATEGGGYDEGLASPNKPREGVLGSIKDTVGGAAAALGSKMGYYTEVDRTPATPAVTDPNAPSVVDKAKASLGLDKPRDPNAPTLMEKTKATLGLGASSPSSASQPGVVDRVSGAVGSLFSGAPKGSATGEDLQHTFPAQSDYVAHQAVGGRTSTAPTGDYNQPMNRY